jgi:S1-C subfamily serine protease
MLFRMSVAGIGGTSVITRLRGDDVRDVNVAMITPPNVPPAQEMTLGGDTVVPEMTVARVNPMMILRFDLALNSKGVLVVDPGKFGNRAGLKSGDVIVAINNRGIVTSGDVRDALTQPGRRLVMDLVRKGQRMTLRFRL